MNGASRYACPACGHPWPTPAVALWDCCPIQCDADVLTPENAAAIARREALAVEWGAA